MIVAVHQLVGLTERNGILRPRSDRRSIGKRGIHTRISRNRNLSGLLEQRDVALQHCRELLTGDGVIGTQVVLTVTGHNAGFKAECHAGTIRFINLVVVRCFLDGHACIGCGQFRVNELCAVVNRFGNRAAVFRRIEPRKIFFTVDMTRRQHDVVLNHIADCGREPRVLRQLVFLLELGIGQVLVVLGVKVVFLLVGGLCGGYGDINVIRKVGSERGGAHGECRCTGEEKCHYLLKFHRVYLLICGRAASQ